jgi:hypothetical protein
VKAFLKTLALILVLFTFSVVLLKGCQKICWDTKATILGPPSLDSWDPTERWEAARQAAKKYGGKE